MLIGNLTKFHYKKKEWITPKHPLYFEPVSFKIYYCAAVIMQAEMDHERGVLYNFELERLLYKGLGLDSNQVSKAMELSKDAAEVMDYLYSQTEPGAKRYFLMLDLFNVSVGDEELGQEEAEFLQLFSRMLDIPELYMNIFQQFIQAAYEENEGMCRSVYRMMERENMEISLMDLKYYLMTLYDTYTCTQKCLEEQQVLRLVDRCLIEEDLVLRPGMRLIFDRAVVRIYGNIALEGGELIIEHSRIVRKSDSHRACINIRSDGMVKIIHSEIDCRNQGMFIRAQDGRVLIKESEIYQTTRGAAVRFWGKRLEIQGCYFHHCYSPEDGGAVMIRGGQTRIINCRFRHCEARKGGAVFGVEPMEVTECSFEKCYVSEYGAAVYYVGSLAGKIKGLSYQECFPEGEETIQYLSDNKGLDIESAYEIGISTILDCEIDVFPQGCLRIHDAVVYLRHPIRCRGRLEIENVRMISGQMEQKDMIIADHGRGCQLRRCTLDGMGEHGGIFASGTRIEIEDALFCNMKGGRAVFNALAPQISKCTFNYCQDGGIHCQGGTIQECQFVNCRGKSGAGVMMLGKKGLIRNCQFIRCVSDLADGAIDRSAGHKVEQCEFRDC